MTTDVTTTPRKPLTPKQRLKMFEAHRGLCVLCSGKITDASWVDEHLIPLNLGGSNDLSNRGPAHKVCAAAKTHGKDGDIAKGAKAKRQKIAQVVGKAEPAKKIESKGFPAKAKREPKASLPPRPMYQ